MDEPCSRNPSQPRSVVYCILCWYQTHLGIEKQWNEVVSVDDEKHHISRDEELEMKTEVS